MFIDRLATLFFSLYRISYVVTGMNWMSELSQCIWHQLNDFAQFMMHINRQFFIFYVKWKETKWEHWNERLLIWSLWIDTIWIDWRQRIVIKFLFCTLSYSCCSSSINWMSICVQKWKKYWKLNTWNSLIRHKVTKNKQNIWLNLNVNLLRWAPL